MNKPDSRLLEKAKDLLELISKCPCAQKESAADAAMSIHDVLIDLGPEAVEEEAG